MSVVEFLPDGDQSSGVQTITELVRTQMDTTGRSYRDLEAVSDRAGFRVKFQTFQELATAGPRSWPKSVDTIRGLAAALDVTEQAVVLAYASALGVRVRQTPLLVQQLPASTGELGSEMRAAIVNLVRAATASVERDSGSDQGGGHGLLEADGDESRGPDPTRADLDLAAYEAPPEGTLLEQWDRQHAGDGEESQDSEGWEPA